MQEDLNSLNEEEIMETILKREILVSLVTSQAHEDWRREWKSQNGETARVKKTTDTAWAAAHNGKDHLDIAATAYEDLPSDWQRENRLAAEVAVDAVIAALEQGRVMDSLFIEEVSAICHEKWIERNALWASAEQKRSYFELPESEKEKDRLFVRRAMVAVA